MRRSGYAGFRRNVAVALGKEWDQTADVQIQQWADVFAFLARVSEKL